MATITSAGAVPDSPSTLRDELIAAATALSPSLTANLPASLVEDLSSTGAGALVVQDQAYVDLINSIAPTTATEQVLIQLGNTYGVPRGIGSNTSVYVVFTGTVGFVINTGFIVSDGTNQFITQDPAVIPAGGVSDLVYCLATNAGSIAVPANTVTTVSTSVPAGVTLTVNNPNAGLVGKTEQPLSDYRQQVIEAGRAVATGVPTLLKTTLAKIDGVQRRLISVRQTDNGWEVICGGGDPYAVANGIFQSMFNIQDLEGAQSLGTTQTITLLDFPDSYEITYVVPVQLPTTMIIHWATVVGTNYVSNTVVSAAVQTPIQEYINSLTVGQSISIIELERIFTEATAAVINPSSLSNLSFDVYVNSVQVIPSGLLFPADPEGYYYINSPSDITVLNP